ncbi:MAG: head GIN domain-containing protein [Cyclobacteriaceae bacterium]
MKSILGLIVFVAVSLVATAQQTEERKLDSFKGVKAAQAVDVYLKKGDKESARVVVSGVDPDEVVTEVAGSYLKVHMREGNYRGSRSVKVYVTYVTLEKLSASSAANIFSESTIKTERLDVSASSAASIEVAIDAGDVLADVSSAADIVMEGKARTLEAEASSAGDIDAYNLECESVTASVSSAGSAKVNCTKEIDAQASSGGTIRYRGNPGRTNTSSSSGGSVKKSN